MNITGTHFNYFLICHRKLWLFNSGLNMEKNSALIQEGKLVHEYSYKRRNEQFEEIELDGIKVDFYDTRKQIIHEIKKSDKWEVAHEWQLKYYIFVFRQYGIEKASGILEYPLIRKTKPVNLINKDEETILNYLSEIREILNAETCPSPKQQSSCKHCSYFDLCWAGEERESSSHT